MRGVAIALAVVAFLAPALTGSEVAAKTPAAGPASSTVEERTLPVTEPLPYEWVDLGDGVYAALQPEGNRFNDSNSVVIVNDEDVVVVDSQNYPQDVRALIAKIRSLTDKPVRYVINTHWHGDHTQGNDVYRSAFPGVEIVGHPTLRDDIPGRAAPMLEEQIAAYREAIPAAEARLVKRQNRAGEPLSAEGEQRLTQQIADARSRLATMEEIELAPPDLTVTDRMTLVRGERRIIIRAYRAHTRGDLVVHLPREKILVTGDVLDDLPYGGHGYPTQWVATLEELEKLDFETQIPGHGRIRNGKGHLRLVRAMFVTFVREAARARRDGKSLEELQGSIDLEPYRSALAGDDPIAGHAFDQFVPPTLERAWLEAAGELDD